MTAAGRRRTPLVLLETATLLSGTGNGVAVVALPWLVLERTGSATAAGVVAAATALPLLLSSLVSGTVVDLIGRRRTALVSDALSALSVAAIPAVDALLGLNLGWIVALAVLGAVFDPAGLTARETLLPAAAHAAGWRIERANGVHEAIFGLAFLVGPGVGGLLIAAIGPVSTLWVTAAGFTLAVLLIAAVRLPGSGRPERPPSGLWRGTAEGLRFVWRDPLLRTLALVTMVLVALYLPVEGVLLPVWFVEQGQPARLGTILMAMSAGVVVGALASGVAGRLVRRRTLLAVALVVTGGALLGLAFLPAYPVMLVFSVLVGLAYGPVNPLTNYAMQTRTPERLRGRVVGVMTSFSYAAGPAGYLLAGPLVEWLGVRTAFLVLAGALLAATVVAAPLPVLRALDQPPRYPPAPSGGPSGRTEGPVPLGEQWIPSAHRDPPVQG
ncbi:MFS transporter [Micromonospora endolithica]|uniref:Multidrug efflux pump Tap n=1 Tax=Micromonospora endolithica TaxID=230091 RepID=A0A3A9ZK48_9ACTN|nr:MFS transporter [Micromonospora endolithica]RKN48234.1 MFS transporter [Micromonospora endolithica]TWJ24721.1 putative MFS family arabinose efflux permease [Micromonospora endolithica]